MQPVPFSAHTQPGAGGDSDRLGPVGLRTDDGIRIRGVDRIAAVGVATVRDHGDHYRSLFAGGIGAGGLGAYQNVRLRAMAERMWSDLDVAIDETYRRNEE